MLSPRLMSVTVLLLAAAGALQAQGVPGEPGRLTDRSSLWERTGKDVLRGFCNMYQFRVVQDPSDPWYPFKAWFFGWASADGNPGFHGCDAIFAARSSRLDGGWEVFAGRGQWDATMTPSRWVPVIHARDFPFDQWHNGDPSVIKIGGRWFMAYSSTGFNLDGKPYGDPQDTDGSLLCVMGATSGDGVHWRKSAQPILLHKEDLGARPVPEGDSHLYGSYQRPSLMYDQGRFKLWFDYWAGPEDGVAMGCAENQGDFLNPADWHVLRAGKSPCLPQFPNPSVVRIGELYFAFGDPALRAGPDCTHVWKARKITEAVSRDGLDWVVLGHIEPDRDAPAIHVPEPFVWRQGADTWLYLFYACQIGGEPVYNYRYDRIRFMRRKVTAGELADLARLCARSQP